MSSGLPSSAIVAVVGAGAMGAGIAQLAALAGHPVRVLDLRPGAAEQAIAGIRATLDKLAAKGRVSATQACDAVARLEAADAIEDLREAALVVEAIVERLDAKRQLFASLEALVAEDCILATNTSSISVTAIAAGLRFPERVVGMHFFNPAPLMALVEVVSGLATDRVVAERIHATARAWGKTPVHARSTPGFIVNRVARPYYAEALRLLNERAAAPATIDAVMREAGGFRMGPFELMDLIGHDVNFAVTRSVFEAYFGDPRFTPSLIQQELVDAGWLGRKTGRGFYLYGAGASLPQAATEPPRVRTAPITVWTDTAEGAALAGRLREGGIAFERVATAAADGCLLASGDARAYLTDGRTAAECARATGVAATVVVDIALDLRTATRIAAAAADGCNDAAFECIVAVLQAAGLVVSRLDDVPGLAVMRTVAMLANEAADAVLQGVCDVAGADAAMRGGVNYPRGPLEWADAIGLPRVLAVLDNLARTYGEDRYRASALLRRRVAGARAFHA